MDRSPLKGCLSSSLQMLFNTTIKRIILFGSVSSQLESPATWPWASFRPSPSPTPFRDPLMRPPRTSTSLGASNGPVTTINTARCHPHRLTALPGTPTDRRPFGCGQFHFGVLRSELFTPRALTRRALRGLFVH